MSFDNANAGTAFALVIAAGAATAIGAAVVFFPKLAKLANRRFLGCSLGLAAGVMLYVSMVDIYGKAITGFMDSGHSEGYAFMYTTLCFFGGIFLMMGINFVVGLLLNLNRSTQKKGKSQKGEPSASTESTSDQNGASETAPACLCCGDPTDIDIDKLQAMADYIAKEDEKEGAECDDDGKIHADENQHATEQHKNKESDEEAPPVAVADLDDEDDDDDDENPLKQDTSQLMHMGAATALAIAIHNLPEGLITFVAYTNEPAVGIVLAIGIGIHNIPEGLCVAMPIYYATGNRWKAFLWGTLSGVSEPIGALIGYVVLKGSMSGNTYGIMFGVVAGIMTLIAADELLPTAHRYDPNNQVVTYSFIVGMAAIAASLVLFSV